MVKVNQAATIIAIVFLCAVTMVGIFLYPTCPKVSYIVIPTSLAVISGIASNAVSQSKERVVIEQPKDWKGTIIFVTGEDANNVKTIVEKVVK